tara:strand:- start:5078 stop:6859 length:1782 start_codon:yes stop_codon:yes gene_type:complete
MCGINGFNFKNEELLNKMSKITQPRGPDYTGNLLLPEFSISHNRLAIIDTKPRSNQPFIFKNLIISFNGEIFNYLELKKKLELKGHKFDTTSDTEVIIRLFSEYNIEAFRMLSGIFAISIYDKLKKKIYLIRDVLGVKPFYYYYDKLNKKFFFSSLVKPLLLSLKKKTLNLNAIISYSNFNRNDYDETFFKEIYKIRPGQLITFDNGNINKENFLKFNFKKNNLVNFKNNLSNIFSNQFISDVPVALSLSGGVDSNLIFSLLRKSKNNKFNAYSVFFEGSKKFSRDFFTAKKIASKYEINLNPISVKPIDFIDTADKIVDIVEEPVGNTNSIANYILSKNVNEKVLFSGDGGDEIFTGYDRYKSIHKINILNYLNPLKSFNFKFRNKNLNRFFLKNSRDFFLSFSEQNLFKNQNKVYKNFKYFNSFDLNKTLNHSLEIETNTNVNSVMYHDLDTWIQNDVLLRNDKIYSNSSIECRVPFLDQNIIENFLLVNDFKKYGVFLNYKHLIRKNFKRELENVNKAKLGFDTPFSKLLREDLYKFSKEILSKSYYNSNEIINIDECNKLLENHKNGYCDPYLIWNLISLQIFLKQHNF